MSKLVNLQHLDIRGTRLEEMPSEMGKLKKLRKLTDFFLGKQSGSSIKELGKLLHLRESLSIWDLQNVVAFQDALDADLKGKKQIKKLSLRWNGDTDDTQHEMAVLEKLEPCVNLIKLRIYDYGGTKFPNWVGNSSFSIMVSLVLIGCKYCTSLPPLGQLPSLENLHIEGFDEVVAVGLEFYGIVPLMDKPFKSLKKLNFEKMPEWQEWNTDVVGAFLLLEDLQIWACPKFVGSFPGAPKLIQFNLNPLLCAPKLYPPGKVFCDCEGCKLKARKREIRFLLPRTEVEFFKCSSLKSCQLDSLPHFSKFTIRYCVYLESLCIREGPLRSLHRLMVEECPNLKSLPENMHSLLPSLEELQLSSLPEVDSFPKGRLPSKLNSLFIQKCIKLNVSHFIFGEDDDVESFPEETLLLPSTLTSLEIQDFRNLKSLDYKGLQHLTSLRQLCIGGCPKLEFIPEVPLPSSIEHLEIWKVKDLDYSGLQHLTSLRRLAIRKCPKLESLPEEGLPSSLEYLEIADMENLKSLNFKGLQIRTLKIELCRKLASMPEQRLPSPPLDVL